MNLSNATETPKESRKIRLRTSLLFALLAGIIGAAIHGALFGHYFVVREERIYPTAMGDLRWRYVTDTDGLPFLDPGITQLELKGRTLYKAKRYFQENWPVVDDVKVTGNTIAWDDGEYAYSLQITPSPEHLQDVPKGSAAK